MISDDVVEQVAQAADIVAIIGEHVRLKKTGSVYRGPCPFHQGTNNNFSVVPKGGYTCFVCGEKGSVFTFVQKRLGLSFVEAVKYVGEKSGIEVQEVRRTREGPDPREPHWELYGTVAQWFREMLWERAAGEPARSYLASRSVSRTTAERFDLGFAPREIGLMRAHLNSLGFTDERLLAAGLLVKREEQEEPRPRFRDRLLFPIKDLSGHVVGFGGRLLGPGEPKYLNSADSEIFSKGRILYNLSGARTAIRRDERIIVVEGYFDVVRLVEAGVESVVAPMGTALTDGQADLIARYTRHAFLLYDSDAPGQKASFRAADVLLARGLAVRVVTLPEGEDPDTFVARHGREAIDKLLAASMDVFDRKVQLLERGGWFADLQRKRRALDALLPTLRATADPITRDMYVQRASEAAKLDRTVLLGELAHEPARGGARSRLPTPSNPAESSPPIDRVAALRRDGSYRSEVPGSAGELALLRVMLLHPVFADAVTEEIGRLEEAVGVHPDVGPAPGDADRGAMRDPVYRSLYEALKAHGAEASVEQIAESLDEAAVDVLQSIKAEPLAVVDPVRTKDDALRMLNARLMQERLAELDRMTPLADGAEKDGLIREKETLRRELNALGGRSWKSVRRSID
jgi:DNA primase